MNEGNKKSYNQIIDFRKQMKSAANVLLRGYVIQNLRNYI